MSVYEALVWLHVTGAVLWVGGGIMLALQAFVTQRSADPAELAMLIRRVGLLGGRYLGPLSGITVLLGVGIVIESDAWSFRDFWVAASLVLWLVSAVVGGRVLSPRAEGLASELTSGGGALTSELRARADRLFTIARADSVLLLVVVFLMTVKLGS